jgi:hypothetical protein
MSVSFNEKSNSSMFDFIREAVIDLGMIAIK